MKTVTTKKLSLDKDNLASVSAERNTKMKGAALADANHGTGRSRLPRVDRA
jgi:hypothetical protein